MELDNFQHLTLARDAQGGAYIALNRPEVHNAFNEAMIAEITAAFAALAQDESVRLVVLSGEGASFCAGGDLHWMRKMKDFSYAENLADSERLAEMFYTVDRFPKPVIAKIHGVALGGGTGLAAVSDFVLASEDAQFGLTEVRLGIVPAVISPFVVAKIGESNARAYFLSGARFTAMRAKEIGLAHEVLPNDEALENATEAAVNEFMKAAPGAAQRAKILIREVQELHHDEVKLRAHTCEAIAKLRVGDEGQEGMSALLEKRKATWIK